MALSSTRYEIRLALSNVDRDRQLSESVVLARHPSETQSHLVLRLLALCLLHDDGLGFGPGLSTPDAADLWAHDLTGRLTTWIECGAAAADKLRKLQQHHPGLGLHVVLDDARRARELAAELGATRQPRGAHAPELWLVDAALVAALAEREERRQHWTVTVVGEHLYIEADGRVLDGAVAHSLVPGAP